MFRMFKNFGIGGVLLGLALAIPAHAGDGRIPVFAPTTLSTPGHYVVTRNITVTSGSILTISTSNVEIDLNGFTLDGGASASPVISSSGFDGITIRNGTILGGSRAMEINGGSRILVEDLHADGSPGTYGVLLIDVEHFAVRRNLFRDFNTAVLAFSNSVPTIGTVEDNVIEDCGQAVALNYAEGSAILNNRVKNAPSNGIQILFGKACMISGNTINGGVIRLSATHGTTISHNVVSNAPPGNIGIDLGGDDNLLLENTVTNGASIGIAAGGDRNHLVGNVSNGNSKFGIIISGDDTVYRGNTAMNNSGSAGDPPACAAPCSAEFCVYTGSLNSSSLGDNRLPGPPTAPACI